MRRLILLVVFLFPASLAFAQFPLSMSGTSFSFGVIEGAENTPGGVPSNLAHGITLTVLSPFNGSGNIASPSGFAASFIFSAMKPTVIALPDSLIQLKENGITKKGLIVTASQPISLVLRDAMFDAGEATQILPNESLDTDYCCPSWGLWNDVNESNHSEILVTASADNTSVTLTPAVMTLASDSAKKPINVTLNAGECYMLKCDTTHGGGPAGLSGTTVRSSKPVSVIVGTTCAYIPFAVQSCNELMDEITGRSHWRQSFYVGSLGNTDTNGAIQVLLTSDSAFYYTVNDVFGFSNGRSLVSAIGPLRIFTSQPAYVQELAEGSSLAGYTGFSDPTMVTVLDSTSWSDTLMWQTLPLQDGKHYISLIYPSWKQHEIMLDDRSLDSLNPPQSLIEGSALRSFVVAVDSGVHTVTSPVPISGIASGWTVADGYSFLPGTFSMIQQRSVKSVMSSIARIAVTPNPSPDRVSIYLAVSSVTDADISIVNILGEEIAHVFHGRIEGDDSFEWEPRFGGFYECIVTTPTGQTAIPVIIQR